jgi:glycosyltransferase involved in cell wall biosynthesis
MLITTNKDLRTAGLSAAWLDVPVVIRRAMARPLRDTAHYRYLYGRLAAHVVTNSRATHRIMLNSAPWLDEARTSVVHNGIDLERSRTAEPVDLGVPADGVAVGFVGRFVEWKGVLTLADAWRSVACSVPNAHLVLAGAGEMEREMRSRLEGVERVHWSGFRDDIPRVMRSLDILAFPSTMEGFGLAAVEAMAAGVPVIAAEAGSLPEVVGDGGAGLFHPPGDAHALADAIRTLVDDPPRRKAMGAAGRRRAEEEFSLERMVDRYETLLEDAVE